MEQRRGQTITTFRWFILIFLVISPLSGEGGGALVRQDSFNPIQVKAPGDGSLPDAPFGDRHERVLRFFPPLAVKESPYLRLLSSGTGSETITLLFAHRTVSLSLPDFQEGMPVYVELPEDSFLQGIILPLGSAWAEERISSLQELPRESFLKIVWDSPEVLEYIPSPSDREGDSFYSLWIANRERIRIDGIEDSSFFLRSSEKPQHITLYPGQESAATWSLSPLKDVSSLRFDRSSLPEFPAPLPMEMVGVLSRSAEEWRNPDFELYSWSRFPQILIWDCQNYGIQDRFFRRLAYYVEKKGYRGRLLTNRELAGKHGWNAHDYRSEDLANFFNLARRQQFPLYDEERMMLDILLENGILQEEENGVLVPGWGAIISISRESSSVLRERFLVHEASHGLYFTSQAYRDFILSVWEGLEEDNRTLWRLFLGWYGYDPHDEDLMVNEFQAYLVQQTPDQAAAYFDIRMNNMIGLYPSQAPLIRNGTKDGSKAFRLWAEKIGHWIWEEWGLLPGDFFPLYKDVP